MFTPLLIKKTMITVLCVTKKEKKGPGPFSEPFLNFSGFSKNEENEILTPAYPADKHAPQNYHFAFDKKRLID